MAKVLPFSRYFPAYHPRAGQPTHFVEKLWNAHNPTMGGLTHFLPYEDHVKTLNHSRVSYDVVNAFLNSLYLHKSIFGKVHTIRAGKRWKTGDMASLRVWSGKPYASKQIIIMPDIFIPRVADIEINKRRKITIDGKLIDIDSVLNVLANNDGLSRIDMMHWFNKVPFSGQIIFQKECKTPY
jgi:hypothetical protein